MRKFIIIIIILVAIVGIVTGIIVFKEKPNEEFDTETKTNQRNTTNRATIKSETDNPQEKTENNTNNRRIKLLFNNKEMFVKLENNPSSNEFLEMLPLTVTLEDYNKIEKIATLPNRLTTQGSPAGYTPKAGDFSYYAPWGNLSLFYKDFGYSNSLIKLGTFESDVTELEKMQESSTVKIEIIEE